MPAVILQDVAHRFGRRWALRGVSLRVMPGEVLALTGHNGSGKSTLLRVVATAVRPTRGQATVCGANVVQQAHAVRALVALLSTEPGVYGDLTALENLRFAARMLGTDHDETDAQRVLEAVGLGAEGHQRARSLSSGMQRRLSIARLLLREPRVLLLDEPYNSLDTDGVALVNTLIRRTTQRGGSVMLVAHDLVRAGGLADRELHMHDGLLYDSEDARVPGTAEPVAVS